MTERRALFAIGAMLLVLAVAGQWRPLLDPDEGRYVAVALEMLDSGDWFTPRLRADHPHLSKPPLAYWSIASSMAIFGRSELAGRLPWSLAYLGAVAVVWAIARRWMRGTELSAIAIFGTMLLPWIASRILTSDALLALLESVAMLGFVVWRTGKRTAGLWVLWLGLGLAVLTKGPPGLIPLLPVIIFLGLRDRPALVRLFSPLPVAAFLIIGSSWYVAQAMARPDVVDYWIGSEVLGRLGSDEHVRHSGPFGAFEVYIPTILLGALPWTLLLFRRRKTIRTIDGDARLLLILWMSVPLVVFLLARSRLPLYLLPLATPAALWIGASVERERILRPLVVTALGLWTVALTVVASVAHEARPDRNGRALARAIIEANANQFEEIVFVNENPAWSLRFYLERPLQRVNLDGYADWGDRGYRRLAKRPHELLAEADRPRLYLLPRKHYVAFRNEMRESGRGLVRLGHFDRLVFFSDEPLN